MMLDELEPRFLKYVDEKHYQSEGIKLQDADGIIFLCPKCFEKKGNKIGVHSIICWTPAVPVSVSPGPGRWRFHGSDFSNLSLIAGSSSILLNGGCNAHFFVTNGAIVWST